ncbi:hypothetical protein PVAND_010240 [Polypedilum vanderplanki]|uniref:Aminopeptidase N n=1 Tax=Polypedilum vanderplanki TaxID=319348 RepID=A0A9J6CEZ1_POLVA|nr:hypothetical protein PVAND_010240 [Polypedilum vanderplanki]
MVKWKSVIKLVAVLVLITVINASPYIDSVEEEEVIAAADDPNRLPTDVLPVHYGLFLETNVHRGDRAYSGYVHIIIRVITATSSIILHSRGLTIESLSVKNSSIEGTIPSTHSFDTSRDFLIIDTDTVTLTAGAEYYLEIYFRGNLRTDMGGFYRSQYQVDGETVPRYLAATQFQSTSARTAFPCFDEPAMKATFEIGIRHATEYDAISNTEGEKVDLDDGTSITSFGKSPIMSSYLNAWVISDFAYRSLYNGPHTTEHRVYAREKDVENVKASLENSDKFLRKLEEYCNYTYELNKMYSAAIPDFAAGAMENWGLILYKEQYLINNEKSHPRETFDMWRVTAHELGHQFFGNLVTYNWWDKIWLNEGWATFFEYKLVELIYPEERLRDFFNTRSLQPALRRDSLQSTQPMTTENSKPTEINYNKGGAVIRMFQYSIGDELFRAAIHKYLTDNNHKPVATEDMLAAYESILSEAGGILGLNFSRAFKTWEMQKGYPLVTVRFDETISQFRITQEKYLSLNEEKLENDDSSWYIPLSYTTGANPDFDNNLFTDFFPDGQAEKTISTAGISGFDASQWYIFNLQQLGYYRVNYDENNWRRIIEVLNSDDYTKIHVLNRAQLVDDALTLAFDGVISYDIALGVVSYLARETDYMPWYPAVYAFDKLDYILKGRPLHDSFRRFVRTLIRKMYVAHGLESKEGLLLSQFGRELAIDWTCRMGDQGCLDYAYSQLTQDIPKPLDIALVCNGLKGLNRQTQFVQWYQKFQKSSDQSDRLRYLDGLLCSSDPKTLVDLLETTLGTGIETFYRSHERSRIYSNIVSRSSAGLEALTTFILKLYDEIVSTNGNVISNWLITASNRVSDYADEVLILDTLDKIVEMGKTVSADTRQRIAANINSNKDWVASEKYQDASTYITNYLKKIDDVESSLRLLKTSEPLYYKIHLNVPNVQTGALPYTGEVTIDVLITESTDYIMFHSKRQTINSLKVHDRYGNEIQILDYRLQTSADTITIYFVETLDKNSQISVNIKYSTNLLTSSTGFYRTTYTQGGVTKYLAATQFQPSSARYSFPCYDEPGFKTPFELSILHDKSYTAIANTLGTTIDNGDGTVTTKFEPTPRMSSYLLAYVVSEFASITNEATRQPREVLHRVWTKPDSISKAPYALENSVKALKALESYCNFDFALSKVDSAAIPNKNSAMENWGMVTYWETAMIYQENFDNISHTLRFSGVRVIAHELAHQFFGDAVTCQWWDQIWLNEGFATIMQYTLVDQFEPTWRMHDFMTTFTMHNTAFISDSRPTTRPMTNYVETLTQIDNAFDSIAYEKSGCVIRMFQHAVGENIFRNSLKLYLTTNNFKPVVSQNLVDAFTATMESNNLNTFNFDRAFRTWENQKGYPLIHVRYDPLLSAFRVTQQRFFEYKDPNNEDESSWYIPLNFATQSNPSFTSTSPTHFFLDGEEELQIPVTSYSSGQWVVFNKQQFGYYRVNYDEDIWIGIINVLNSDSYTSIHVMNRAQLIDDSFALAKGGYIDYSIPFDILKYLVRENDFFPWYTAYRHINALITSFGYKDQTINKFFKQLSNKFYEKFQLPSNNVIPNDDLPERYGRDYATFFACNNGNELCLDDAYSLVKQYAHNDQLIPNGLERIYCSGLRGTGKEDEFVAIWHKMSLTSDATFKSTLISALGCSDNTELLKDFLYSSLGSGNSVNYTTAQRQAVLSAVLQSYSGLPVVLDFISKAQSEITSNYGRTLLQILTTVAGTIKTVEDQMIFSTYVVSNNQLTGDNIGTLLRTVNNNIQSQNNYAYQVSQIKRIIDEWENGVSDEGSIWRLPYTSKPEYYRVHLDVRNIHTGALGYSGEATINIAILEKTNYVVFHSKNQVITELSARNLATNNEIVISKFRLTPAYDTILIYFANELAAGTKIAVTLKYSTNLVTSATGFYRTSYVMDGTTRYVGATQFESTGARYAFPCYDEPDFKAIFELSFTHDASVVVHSNTMETIVNNGDGTHTTSFKPSPIMSTYLNAFVVSDFAYIDNSEGLQPGETLQRVIVQSDSLNKAQLGLVASVAALKALEEFVGFKYEIDKLDSIMVPGKSGAMENWGLITYSTTALVYEENIDDALHTQVFSGVRVIAHEVTHQFFGNAVTCKWWSYIWLNEGFARLLQYTLTDMFYPEWRMQDFMNVMTLQATAFIADARITTRAMTTDAETPAQISALFDNIAYDKSGSVIRMFEYAVGETIFRQSLNHYITTHEHTGAVSQDLIDSFKITMQRHNFNDFDFERAFRTWETQKGYPVIHVSYMSSSPAFHITQQRFYSTESQREDDGSSWYIPINYATSNNPNFDDTKITDYFLNGEPSKHIEIATPLADGFWFVFNKQQRGYYRVNYDESNWDALSEVLNSDDYSKIHVMNRAQLIDDSYALVNAGYLNDYQTALNILKYLYNENDFFPWYTANRYISPLYTTFGNKNEILNAFIKKLSAKFYAKYKLTSNTVPVDIIPERYGRVLAIDLACRAGNEDCLSDAFSLVHGFADHDVSIPKGLESILCHGFRGTGKQNEFVATWRKMQLTSDTTYKTTLINALGCSDDPVLLKDYLESSLGSGASQVNYTQAQRRAVFSSVLQSNSAIPVVINFLKKFQSEVVSSYGQTLQTTLNTLANSIKNTNDQILFNEYVLNLNVLNNDAITSLLRTVTNNLNQQNTFANSRQMEVIKGIVNEWEFGIADGHQLILPESSKPEYYRVHFDVRNVHTGVRDYSGEVTIHITMLETTNRILFHSKNQVINELKVFDRSTMREISVTGYRLYPSTDTIMIMFSDAVSIGAKISVNIKYSTSLLTYGDGFYQTSYTMEGRTRYVAATQFESTGARFAFPCYDEPDLKAVFELSFTHDASVVVHSNTMETIVDNEDGTHTTSFKPSPIMSTYLNAFVVSDFAYIDNSEGLQPGETLQRVIVQSDSLEKAQYGLISSIAALKALEEFVGFKYEIDKLDSIMVPGKGGAMENWGLITYAPTALVYEVNPNNSPHTRLFSGVRVIAHEVTHQFFGNAVTCKWWSYIWLNEGFAQFLQYALTDMFHPEWRMYDFMNVLSMQSTAFSVDGRNTTRAMTTDARTPQEIDALFDSIAYDKSGNVLRMFMNTVTESIFRQALNLYVNTNNHKGAVSQDLVDAFVSTLQLTGTYTFPFDRAFRTWETQKGFPVIHVRYDSEIQSFQITQERFFNVKEQRVNDGSSWYIPLNYATAESPNFDDTKITDFFVDGEDVWHIFAPNHQTNNWYVFNKKQTGYYRVNYDENNWKALSDVLSSANYNIIHVMNRAQLIDDSFALVNSGYLNDYQTAYNILKYLVNENDYFPWYTANRYLNTLYNIYGNKHSVLNNFVKTLSDKFYAKYKLPANGVIPNDVLPERYGRALAINLACVAGNENCLADTLTLVQRYAQNDQKIPAGLESILCHGLRGTGKANIFVDIWRISQVTADATWKTTLLNALGCTDDSSLLFDYLESSLGSGTGSVNYTAANRQTVFTSSLQSKVAIPVFIQFMQKNNASALSNYRYTWPQILTTVANSIKTRDDQILFNDYIATVPALSGDEYKSISLITANALSQQRLSQYARQIEILSNIFPLDPRLNETTTVASTMTTTSTSTLTTTSSTITITDSTTSSSSTTTESITLSVTDSTTSITSSSSISSSTTSSTSSSTTTPQSTSTTNNPDLLDTTTITTTTLGASTNGIKFITLAFCIALTFFIKF